MFGDNYGDDSQKKSSRALKIAQQTQSNTFHPTISENSKKILEKKKLMEL